MKRNRVPAYFLTPAEQARYTFWYLLSYLSISAVKYAAYLFIIVSIQALAFRWAFTLSTEIIHWYIRDILNPLAGIFPGTS